jgi:hypothetical protein
MTRPLSRARHTVAALIGTAALVAAPLAVSPAHAAERPGTDKPAKADKAKAPGTKQLLKTVSGKDKRLVRLSTSSAVTRLDDAYETEVVAGIEESRDALAAIRTAVEAADATVDTRAAAKDLRAFRVENHRLVVNVVAKADRILDAATLAGDAETAALATTAIEAALAVTATSPKSEIKAARAGLVAAEDAEDEAEDEALPVA